MYTKINRILTNLMALQLSLTSPVAASGFWADGFLPNTGKMTGRTVFSISAMSVWSSAMIDPTSIAQSVGAESAEIMGGNDNVPIAGVKLIDSSSPYFPR
jgi:hypothetical protein